MGDYTLISDIGNTLVKLLQKNMVPEPVGKPEMIGLCSPNEPGEFTLTAFLYHIEESGEYRRNEMIAEATNKLRYPPVSLKLNYLVTAHSKAALSSRCLDENLILGRVIQTFNDNRTFELIQQDGTVRESDETLQIEYNNLSYDELRKIWSFTNAPYKLSLSFTVKPVLIDSKRTREVRRVAEAEFTLEMQRKKR
jgi:hypothetical protein